MPGGAISNFATLVSDCMDAQKAAILPGTTAMYNTAKSKTLMSVALHAGRPSSTNHEIRLSVTDIALSLLQIHCAISFGPFYVQTFEGEPVRQL